MSELERERHKNTGLERARDSWYQEWFKGNERITELETKIERLKTRVIAEEDDKNKRLDEMRAALAKQSLHVEDCHRQVEQAEAELQAAQWALAQWHAEEEDWVLDRKMWAETTRLLRLRLETAEAEVARLHRLCDRLAEAGSHHEDV